MAGHHIGTVENTVTGKPVTGATITVYTSSASVSGSVDAGFTVSGTLATIYSDDGVTTVSGSVVTTDSTGFYEFWTDETSVVLLFTYDGVGRRAITDVEIVGGTISSDVTALQTRFDNLDTLLGTSANATDLGTFTGSTISDNGDLLAALQELETALEYAGGTLTDPGADRILFWDDSAGATAYLTVGAGLAISTTTLSNSITEASASEIWTGSETGKYISPDKLFDAAAPQTLTSSSNSVAVDMATGINFNLTLGENSTLANPTNAKAGQSGRIRVTQDGTGSRTLAYGANWKHIGSAPTISTTAGAVDLFAYFVNGTSDIELSYLGVLA